jgi:serine/threonine protein phosphatase PrpC
MAHGKESNGTSQPDPRPFLGTDEASLSSTVQVSFGAQSHLGAGHAVNQDHYAIVELGRFQQTLLTSLPEGAIPARFDERGYAMVVANGIGSPGAGEFASRVAIGTLMHLVLRFGKWNLRVNDEIGREIMERAQRFYRYVDASLLSHGLKSDTPSAQTTLTAVFGAGRDLFFAHIGHSRAYLYRGGKLMRLTRDHTLSSPSLAAAPLLDLNVSAHDLQHILTSALGMSGMAAGPVIDIERLKIDDNDRVLVCTNGLTDAVDEATLEDILSSDQPPAEQCRALIDSAMTVGDGDDVTALVAWYHVPHQTS